MKPENVIRDEMKRLDKEEKRLSAEHTKRTNETSQLKRKLDAALEKADAVQSRLKVVQGRASVLADAIVLLDGTPRVNKPYQPIWAKVSVTDKHGKTSAPVDATITVRVGKADKAKKSKHSRDNISGRIIDILRKNKKEMSTKDIVVKGKLPPSRVASATVRASATLAHLQKSGRVNSRKEFINGDRYIRMWKAK